MRFDAVDRDGEPAHPVAVMADEVGEAHIGPPFPLGDLLAQHRQADMLFILDMDDDVVALAAAGPEAADAARGQPFVLDDALQHLLRVGEQAARTFADHRVVEDRGIVARQFPGAEEGRPVDIVDQILEVPILEDMNAGQAWTGGLQIFVDLEAVGAGVLDAEQLALPLAFARLADMLIIGLGPGDEVGLLRFGDQRGGDADGAAGVEHMDDRACEGRVDAQRGMDLRRGGAADQQRHGHVGALHFGGDRHHLVQRGGDETAEADHVGVIFVGGLEDVLPGHHHPHVDDVEAIALKHDPDDILADVVDVALDGRHDDLALALRAGFFRRLDEGQEMRDRLLHDAGGFHDLGQEHLARAEQVAHDVHAVHQRPFDHLDRLGGGEAGLLRILHHIHVDALDQRMFQPLGDRPAAPFLRRLFGRGILALEGFRERDETIAGFGIGVEQHILARLAQRGIDRVIDVELARIDDRHVEPGGNRVVEEDAVHRPAHRFVAAEGEGEVGEAARDMGMRAALPDLAARLDKVHAVIIMFLDARRDGEDVGIEDDVLRREADGHEEMIGALANLDLAVPGVSLTGFIEGHDDHGGAIGHAFSGMVEEDVDAFLHADRIDDRLARDAFEAGLDHVPFGRVDHDGHAADVRFRRHKFEEGGHRLDRVEQPFVHVHVDDLRAIFHLLARDVDGGGIVAGHDQLLELGGARDIGAFADVDEIGGGLAIHRLFQKILPHRGRGTGGAGGGVSRHREG